MYNTNRKIQVVSAVHLISAFKALGCFGLDQSLTLSAGFFHLEVDLQCVSLTEAAVEFSRLRGVYSSRVGLGWAGPGLFWDS